MILSDLKSYLTEHHRTPISELARHFNADPDAIRGMLAHFIRKGQVRRLDEGGSCSSCQKCDTATLETYEWTAQ